jgi:hypothetical protein
MEKRLVLFVMLLASINTVPTFASEKNIEKPSIDKRNQIEGFSDLASYAEFDYENKALTVEDVNLQDENGVDKYSAKKDSLLSIISDKVDSDGNYKVIIDSEIFNVKATKVIVGKTLNDRMRLDSEKYCHVSTGELDLRKESNQNCEVLRSVDNTDTLEILDITKDDYKVKIGELVGYVTQQFVEKLPVYSKPEEIKESVDVTEGIIHPDELFDEVTSKENVSVPSIGQLVSVSMFLAMSGSDSNKFSNSGAISSFDSGNDLVNYAMTFIGNPYVWGGTDPVNGADCSGFVQTIYKKYDIILPRTAKEQSKVGTQISTDDLQPGDLVFYGPASAISHVAIYAGDGKVVHASNHNPYPVGGIKISNVNYRNITKAIRVRG